MRARVGAAHATDPFSTADGAIRSDAVRCGVCPLRPAPALACRVSAGAGPWGLRVRDCGGSRFFRRAAIVESNCVGCKRGLAACIPTVSSLRRTIVVPSRHHDTFQT